MWSRIYGVKGIPDYFLSFNPLPDDKIVALSKVKSFADEKLNAIKNIEFVFHMVEGIVGKGENAGHQHFLLFLLCF